MVLRQCALRTSEVACRAERRALTSPASWIAPPYSSSFSVSVVLPASGWLMMAQLRRFPTSAARRAASYACNAQRCRITVCGIVHGWQPAGEKVRNDRLDSVLPWWFCCLTANSNHRYKKGNRPLGLAVAAVVVFRKLLCSQQAELGRLAGGAALCSAALPGAASLALPLLCLAAEHLLGLHGGCPERCAPQRASAHTPGGADVIQGPPALRTSAWPHSPCSARARPCAMPWAYFTA